MRRIFERAGGDDKKRACPVRTFHPQFPKGSSVAFLFHLSLLKQCSKAHAKEYEYNKGDEEESFVKDTGVKEIRKDRVIKERKRNVKETKTKIVRAK